MEEYAGGCGDWLEKISRPKEKAKPTPKPKEKPEMEASKKREALNKGTRGTQGITQAD